MTTRVPDSTMARTRAVLPMTISENGARVRSISPMYFMCFLAVGRFRTPENGNPDIRTAYPTRKREAMTPRRKPCPT
ncbi:hypothetical protein JCM14713_30040 [Desulfomicrobium salsuginis]